MIAFMGRTQIKGQPGRTIADREMTSVISPVSSNRTKSALPSITSTDSSLPRCLLAARYEPLANMMNIS